eukprot:6175221-Pleurochrysis_carterae.AAC.1
MVSTSSSWCIIDVCSYAADDHPLMPLCSPLLWNSPLPPCSVSTNGLSLSTCPPCMRLAQSKVKRLETANRKLKHQNEVRKRKFLLFGLALFKLQTSAGLRDCLRSVPTHSSRACSRLHVDLSRPIDEAALAALRRSTARISRKRSQSSRCCEGLLPHPDTYVSSVTDRPCIIHLPSVLEKY